MRINEIIKTIREDEDLDELYDIINGLTPDDVGEERSGQYVLKVEGFTDECVLDAQHRCQLPDGNPRKLNDYDDVYDEVYNDWKKEMGSDPIDYGEEWWYEDNPILWAIYKVDEITEAQFDEAAGEKDACYHKVKSRYKVWPSAYASGALVKCRKMGAANWGKTKSK